MLLLEDLLVLLQKQDEKLLLKCHSKTAVGSADSKQTFSPVLKLNAVLVRSVATGVHAARQPGRYSLGHPPPPVFLRRPAPSKHGGEGRAGGAQMTTDSLGQAGRHGSPCPGGPGSGWEDGQRDGFP